MSNPFNSFDPFAAPAPAPSASTTAKDNSKNESGAAPTIVNPFDNFNFFNNNNSQQKQNNLANNAKDVWQNITNSVDQVFLPPPSNNNNTNNNLNPSLSVSTHSITSMSSLHSSSNKGGKKEYKRIVPYRSPINTLEINWDPWLYIATSQQQQQQTASKLWKNGGNINTYLIVRANNGCCLSGGVESLLKWNKTQGSKSGSSNLGNAGADESSTFGLDSLSMADKTDISVTNSTMSSTTAATTATASDNNKKSVTTNSMRFLKSGLKKAQASIERSVTTMAIKADGGKNRDQLCVSLHYLGGTPYNKSLQQLNMANALGLHPNSTELSDVCLSRTEWVELPPNNGGSNANDDDDDGVLFSIPLCVPDLTFLEQGGDNGVQLIVRLFLRSGATLLKAVANREYCIGESSVLYSNIMGLMSDGSEQQQQPTATANMELKCGSINVPFTTGMLAETSSFSNSSHRTSSSTFNSSSSENDGNPAALHITATPRIKFNQVCTFGWSLTDPVSTPPNGSPSWLNMFQMPLDQGYVFNILGQHQLLNNSGGSSSINNASLLLANERAVESSLTLPLATACSQLFSQAATNSQTLASNAIKKTRRKEALFLTNEDEYRSKAIVEAALLDKAAYVEVGVVALVGEAAATSGMLGCTDFGIDDLLPGVACGFGGVGEEPTTNMRMSFQPPHSVFEEPLAVGACPLLDEESGKGYTNGSFQAGSFTESGGIKEAITARFCPRILSGSDELLPSVAGTKANGRYVGSVRLEVALQASNGPVDNISTGMSTNTSVEGIVELENYLDNGNDQQQQQKVPALIPAVDANTGRRIGTFVLLLRVTSQNLPTSPTPSVDTTISASSGLVSVVGLDTLTEELGPPYIDCDAPTPNSRLVASQPTPGSVQRLRQIATMGQFVTTKYLVNQSLVVRERDSKCLGERHERYNQTILSGMSTEVTIEDDSDIPLYQRHTPRPFRPSHSRGDALLTGIGFNVHVQSISLNMLHDGQLPVQVGKTHSVTHGAPSDHEKGFGGKQKKDNKALSSDEAGPRGGLRRLESKRLEIAKELDDCVTGLINAVGEHFKSRAQATTARQKPGAQGPQPPRHIPPNLPAITHYRSKAIECTQRLHSLTWDLAVRRANCFSQALGIAVTSYMTSLGDGGPTKYASVWARHGYLIAFEGLLSAVGNELGMIEDASVAISMLRMVNVVLVPDNINSGTSPGNSNEAKRIPVPHSPYVRWVNLDCMTTHGSHSKTQYRLEIGLDSAYYQSNIPEPLKNGVPVRFFPVLFQQGVDIRQWGVNAGRNIGNQMKDKPLKSEDADEIDNASGSILDDGDDDDEDGDGDDIMSDNEILYVLNVEAIRKMNAYAHSVMPTTSGYTMVSAQPPMFDIIEQQQQQGQQILPIHPSLVSLSESIKASAGRMEHSVLDRAATACQRMGGGSTVFCKSGKDRTAMQVSFKQAQFVQRYLARQDGNTVLEDTPISYEEVFDKSTLMRKHGNRIAICEKNAGEPKFAFNPLQRKFMPDMLRPDASLCTWSKPET